ncbi:MAG: DUF4013 domain-containing protein [Methanobrevibacter sp.]|uniref:DUF4013 domain-containing protein n=1 Tax=Methanobrevibacter sp. TaxID=66852 RepID=UPI0025F6E67A|nr:DUF4013 domain-containing protein [Methanobrevibacter sp.]MBQ8018084.1 DUF4013 domain-containing protein [Methanobrevibacter sp.]
MDITEIIKRAVVFPSKNLEILSIYAIMSVLAGAFAVEGVVTFISGIINIANFVIGATYIAIAIIIGIITQRISVQCVKSGIELQDKIPDFKWWGNWGLGLKKIVITIFYFIVPALIVIFIALITNVYGNLINIAQAITVQISPILMGSITAEDAITQASFPLFVSLAITLAAGLLLFLVFSFFQVIAEARLAHTDSLIKSLNFISAAKDLKMIGVGKVILLSIIILVIVAVIELILTFIFDHLVVLSILNLVITPYIALFSQSAMGFLYSDIV